MTVCEFRGVRHGFGPNEFPLPEYDLHSEADVQEAVFAGGCFWCVEAVFARLSGVEKVEPGYAGGTAESAHYTAVCSGKTGHAEVIRIIYRPVDISFGQLLKVFFSVAHDPTQLNRQGNDRGPQYRSAVFYANDAEKDATVRYMQQLSDAGIFDAPIVTTVEPLEAFYPAESHHYDYAARNPGQPYIQAVAHPKVDKLQKNFGEFLK